MEYLDGAKRGLILYKIGRQAKTIQPRKANCFFIIHIFIAPNKYIYSPLKKVAPSLLLL